MAKFIRFEAYAFLSFQTNVFGFDWKLMQVISITKFTKNSWCVSVFESTKQHQKCCSIFFNRKDFLFYLIFQASKVGEIHSLWSVRFSFVSNNCFWIWLKVNNNLFYHKVHGEQLMCFCFWEHQATSKMLFNILQSQRFFIYLNILRKQSWRNSFALKRAPFFRFKQMLLDLIES